MRSRLGPIVTAFAAACWLMFSLATLSGASEPSSSPQRTTNSVAISTGSKLNHLQELKGVESGTITLAVGPGVVVTTSLNDFNCVDTQSFNGFTTTSWYEGHGFSADMFTVSHGCGLRAKWVKWNFNIKGGGWQGGGSIWLGQNSYGHPYHSKCEQIVGVVCTEGGNGSLLVTLARCPGSGYEVYAVTSGRTCSVMAPGTVGVYGRPPFSYKITNVTGVPVQISNPRTTIKPGETISRDSLNQRTEFWPLDNYGYLVIQGP